MVTRSVTIDLPDGLYNRVVAEAAQARRPLGAMLLGLIETALEPERLLPGDLRQYIESLALLDDESLWRAARSRFPADLADELRDLNAKQQREALSEIERHRQQALVDTYERVVLFRAQSAVLLQRRGYDVSVLLGPE